MYYTLFFEIPSQAYLASLLQIVILSGIGNLELMKTATELWNTFCTVWKLPKSTG